MVSPQATAALYFHPEAYTTEGVKPMGRNSAGESFLKGFFKHHRTNAFWVQVTQNGHEKSFEAIARGMNRQEPITAFTTTGLENLQAAGCLFLPGPNLSDSAWQRSFFVHSQWSLCGITHTTSSAAAMDAIAGLITGPIQPWDALICTTPTVKKNVEAVMQLQVNYLQERLGIQQIILPQLPVIPLGIECDSFHVTAAKKAEARQRLGIEKDTLVVLFAGRLSFHAKAHPLAMYQALQAALPALPRHQNLLLVELGWHANEAIANAFKEAAQWGAPALQTLHLDSRDPSVRKDGWAIADIFCSLSDNLQEAFGITPIEAMAAGLPVVVSDWDGYRSSIEEGVTGFRLPSLMPSAGEGVDFAKRHALGVDNYDFYCGFTSSLVSIDIEATAEAFRRLFKSPERRQKMGQAGIKLARQRFDWSVIIPQYEALWQGLADIRKAARPSQPTVWPARPDPFHIFASYPSQTFDTESMVRRRHALDSESEQALQGVMSLAMVSFARPVMPSPEDLKLLLLSASSQPRRAEELTHCLPADKRALGLRGLAWLIKLGLLEYVPDPTPVN